MTTNTGQTGPTPMEERHHKLLCNGLSTILEEKKFTDFEIRTMDGTSLHCHKAIMAAVSPFFERMLEIEMMESQTGVVDLQIDSATMTDILSYIYRGAGIVRSDSVANVYYAANFLGIASLVEDCEEFLTTELPAAVSLEIWQIANAFDKHDIAEIAKSKVLQDFGVLCNTECMSILSNSLLKELLTDRFLNCSGTLKCRAAWLWVCSHETTAENVKDILVSLVKAENVENDDILSACANENKDELGKEGEDLMNAQEMWTNACDKLWIQSNSLNPPQLALVPSYDQVLTNDVLVFLDEGKTGKTRLTFFDYKQKKWHKMEDVSNLDLGHRYSVCSDGSLLYISGGHLKYGNQKRLVRFHGETRQCVTLNDMPVGRESHTMCRVGRHLYVLGGVSYQPRPLPYLDDVHRYSLQEGRWYYCGKIALPISQHSSVTVDQVIYLLGGCTKDQDRTPTDTLQFYNTKDNTSGYLYHTLKVKCKSAITSMAVVKDNIYFLFHGCVYSLDPKKGTEKLCAIEGAPQKGFAFVSFEGKILVVGGEDDNFRTVRAITQYDCETKNAVKLPLTTPWPMQDFTYTKMHVPRSWSLDDV